MFIMAIVLDVEEQMESRSGIIVGFVLLVEWAST